MNVAPDLAALPSSPPPAGAGHPDRYERLFVTAAWAVLSAALLGYVLRYGSRVPWMDDWELVPVLSHARPATLRWLWIQQNEHRFPLVKLAFLVLNALSGGDYRVGMLASASVLSAVALAAAGVAARLRGRASYTDAVFPLALLHPGHEQNVLSLHQLSFVSAGALAATMPILIAAGRWRTGTRWAAVLAACLLVLPLNPAIGALLAPPLALWALYVARQGWRAPEAEARRGARLMLGGAVGALALTALYIVGLVRPPYHPPSPSLLATARGAFQVLAMSLGPFGESVWPWSAGAVALLAAVTLLLLAGVVRAHASERPRALGLFVAMAAVLGMLAATGAARAGLGSEAGFATRYAMLSVPLFPAVVLTWVLYGGAAARFMQVALFSVLCMAFSINVQHAVAYGRARRAQADSLLQDVRAGMPPGAVAQRHWRHFYPNPDLLARRLRMLHEAGQGPYRGLPRAAAPVPCRTWLPAPLRPLGGHNMLWRDGVGRPEGPDPYLILGLLEPERVCAVRFTLVHTSRGGGEAPLKVYWARTTAGWFAEERHFATQIASSPEPQTVVVPITDEVDLLRLDPDEATEEFRVTGLELLTGS
jgi:hypothetical protein